MPSTFPRAASPLFPLSLSLSLSLHCARWTLGRDEKAPRADQAAARRASTRADTHTHTHTRWAEDPQFKDKVYFAKFDVDAIPELAQELGVRAMPTFFFFKDGEKAEEFVGANPNGLLAVLNKQAGNAS